MAFNTRLGTIKLNVPQEGLVVSRQCLHDVHTPAMSGDADVTSEGRSIAKITLQFALDLAPPDSDSIEILARLIAHTRYSPFITLWSEQAASYLVDCDLVKDNRVPVAINSVQVMTDNDVPGSLIITVDLFLFNFLVHEAVFQENGFMEIHISHAIEKLELMKHDMMNGNLSVKMELPFEKTYEASFPDFDPGTESGVTIQNISVSIENQLAIIPVSGREFSTIQHLGSLVATANILFVNDRPTWKESGSVGILSKIVQHQQDLAVHLKGEAFDKITVKNSLLNACGINHIVIMASDFSALGDGVPGDTISLSIVGVADGDTAIRIEKREKKVTQLEKVKMILSRLSDNGYIGGGGIITPYISSLETRIKDIEKELEAYRNTYDKLINAGIESPHWLSEVFLPPEFQSEMTQVSRKISDLEIELKSANLTKTWNYFSQDDDTYGTADNNRKQFETYEDVVDYVNRRQRGALPPPAIATFYLSKFGLNLYSNLNTRLSELMYEPILEVSKDFRYSLRGDANYDIQVSGGIIEPILPDPFVKIIYTHIETIVNALNAKNEEGVAGYSTANIMMPTNENEPYNWSTVNMCPKYGDILMACQYILNELRVHSTQTEEGINHSPWDIFSARDLMFLTDYVFQKEYLPDPEDRGQNHVYEHLHFPPELGFMENPAFAITSNYGYKSMTDSINELLNYNLEKVLDTWDKSYNMFQKLNPDDQGGGREFDKLVRELNGPYADIDLKDPSITDILSGLSSIEKADNQNWDAIEYLDSRIKHGYDKTDKSVTGNELGANGTGDLESHNKTSTTETKHVETLLDTLPNIDLPPQTKRYITEATGKLTFDSESLSDRIMPNSDMDLWFDRKDKKGKKSTKFVDERKITGTMREQLEKNVDAEIANAIADIYGWGAAAHSQTDADMYANAHGGIATQVRLQKGLEIAKANFVNRLSYRRLYPTIRVYVNDLFIDKKKKRLREQEIENVVIWTKVNSVKIIRSRKVPAALAVIELVDRNELLFSGEPDQHETLSELLKSAEHTTSELNIDYISTLNELQLPAIRYVANIFQGFMFPGAQHPELEAARKEAAENKAYPTKKTEDINPFNIPNANNDLGNQYYRYLIDNYADRGMTHEKAIGMLANAFAESTWNPAAVNTERTKEEKNDIITDPVEWQIGKKKAVGLFQWRGDRREKMKTFCYNRRTGNDDKFDINDRKFEEHWHTDWKSQLDFAMTERESIDYLSQRLNTVEEATDWFCIHWERPFTSKHTNAQRQAELARRRGYANSITSDRAAATKYTKEALKRSAIDKLKKEGITEGTEITIRIGYSNDPDNLERWFTGSIVEIHPGETLTLVVQEYAYELTNPIGVDKTVMYGPSSRFNPLKWIYNSFYDKPKTPNNSKLYNALLQLLDVGYNTWFHFHADTLTLLSVLINNTHHPHFGAWRLGRKPDMEVNYDPFEIKSPNASLFQTRAGNNIVVPNIFTNDAWFTEVSNKEDKEDSGQWWDEFSSSPWYYLSVGSPTTNPRYIISNTTFMDVADEMMLRHPGWIRDVRPYDDEVTFFFGHPSFNYYTSDRKAAIVHPNASLSELQKYSHGFKLWLHDSLRSEPFKDLKDVEFKEQHLKNYDKDIALIKVSRAIRQEMKANVFKELSNHAANELEQLIEQAREEEKLTSWARNTRTKPFQNYHMITDDLDIIDNSMIASGTGTFTEAIIGYCEAGDQKKEIKKGITDQITSDKVVSTRLDDNILEEDIRTFRAFFPNCIQKRMARRYSLGVLYNSLKDLYQGNITIIGNPYIYPHDMIYLSDKKKEIFGIIGVEKVVQEFDLTSGFITHITPDMVTSVNDVALQLTNADIMATTFANWSTKIPRDMWGPMKWLVELGGKSLVGPDDAKATEVLDYIRSSKTRNLAIMTTSNAAFGTIGGAAMAGPVGAAIGLILGLGVGVYSAYQGTSILNAIAESTRWRQPILLLPCIKKNQPFVSGIRGYEYNSLTKSLNDEFSSFNIGIKHKVNEVVEFAMNKILYPSDVYSSAGISALSYTGKRVGLK